jgi:DNA-binding NarL/FixJ family response regulator
MERSITATPREVDFPGHEPQHLGTIWIDCPYPLLSAGLRRALRAPGVRLHQGPNPPEGEAPSASAVICHAERAGAVASKVTNVMAQAPGVPVLVLGLQAELPLARSALQAGAMGFIHAQMPPEQIVRALEVVTKKGEQVLPRELLKALVEKERSSTEHLSGLSPRKLEILGWVAEGLSNAQIARRSFLSESTIKQHLRAAYKVLGVKNRTEAATVFRRSEQLGGVAASAAPSESERRPTTGVPSGGAA